jgi:NAD(P)H-hydrate repair Nnr-like enzyme with NAD(P)H-hydrate epimerase domain
LRALSACKYQANETRDKIFENLKRNMTKNTKLTTEAMIDGLQGIGNSDYTSKKIEPIVNKIYQDLADRVDSMTYD